MTHKVTGYIPQKTKTVTGDDLATIILKLKSDGYIIYEVDGNGVLGTCEYCSRLILEGEPHHADPEEDMVWHVGGCAWSIGERRRG